MDKENLLASKMPASPNHSQEAGWLRKTKGALSHLSQTHVSSLPPTTQTRDHSSAKGDEADCPVRNRALRLKRKRRTGIEVATNIVRVLLCSAPLCGAPSLRRCPLGSGSLPPGDSGRLRAPVVSPWLLAPPYRQGLGLVRSDRNVKEASPPLSEGIGGWVGCVCV